MGEGLANVARRALRVRGVVQGVGFGPAVCRLARALELGGFVRNDADGVLLEIEGDPVVLSRFVEQLRRAAPRRAEVASMEAVDVRPLGEREFRIAASPSDGAAVPAEPDACPARGPTARRIEGGKQSVGDDAMLRRAPGLIPDAIALPVPLDAPILAVGGELRGAICLAHGDRAVLSQHLGHLSNADAYASFTDAIAHLSELVGADPARVAHDLHPEYRSTRWALASGLPTVGVQHHHAHVAACLAEHGRDELVLGVAFDGTGHGDDGGAILEASLHGFRRVAHLRPLALPGGERAIRQPWRLALAALRDAGLGADALGGVDPVRIRRVDRLFDAGVATQVKSSAAGRWFDAVAALLEVRSEITHDAQAAMELEAISAPGVHRPYDIAFRPAADGAVEMDLRPCVRGLAADRRRGVGAGVLGARFHETMARAIVGACVGVRSAGGPSTAALSGGSFSNRRLAERTRALLRESGFDVLTHRRVSPDDGGLALGQVAVAAARQGTGRHRSARRG